MSKYGYYKGDGTFVLESRNGDSDMLVINRKYTAGCAENISCTTARGDFLGGKGVNVSFAESLRSGHIDTRSDCTSTTDLPCAAEISHFTLAGGDSACIDYELTGSGGYGEAPRYDGENLNEGSLKRGFKTVITPVEYTLSIPVGYKEAKVDKMGETKKVGTKLGDSMALTVYLHVLRMFANAWNTDGKHNGGDGVSWANAAHPVASRGSSGRTFVADTDAGTYSNISTDAFSVSAITAAQARANRFLTPDGMPFLCDFDTVLIAPELEEKAKKMFGENARLMPTGDPESAYNAANPVYGMRYIVMGGGADGFTSKQWAVCDRRLMKELVNIVYNTRPTVMQSPQDNPLKDLYTAYADFGVGWGDARQIIFGNPS